MEVDQIFWICIFRLWTVSCLKTWNQTEAEDATRRREVLFEISTRTDARACLRLFKDGTQTQFSDSVFKVNIMTSFAS